MLGKKSIDLVDDSRCNQAKSIKNDNLVPSPDKRVSKVFHEVTRDTYALAKRVDQGVRELASVNAQAAEALSSVTDKAIKNPDKNHMRIEFEPDARDKSKAIYQARIISDNGLTRAEVFGTKSGKSHTILGQFNGKSDRDGLDNEGQEQLKKALRITRTIITGNKMLAEVDDSGSESSTENSEED